MKYLTGYTDPFISPVTGILSSHFQLPDLELGYIWIGDKHNRPTPSFKLIDLTIDLRSLEDKVEKISESTFVLNHPATLLPNAQALSNLEDGMMKNVQGFIEIASPGSDYMKPYLPWQQVWVGNIFNKPAAQSTILSSNLPDLTYKRIWRGNIFNRPVESDGLSELEFKVEELQLQVNELETKVTSLQTAVTELENWQIAAEAQIEEMLLEIGTLQSEVLALQTQVAALEASIVAIEAELVALGAALAALEAEVAGLAATVAGLVLTVAGLSLTVASHGIQIGFLQSDLSSLRSDFDNATVTLVGDVVGVGLLSSPVVTKFAPNPQFEGKYGVVFPSGTTEERSPVPIAGRLRYNTNPQPLER